jgi:hypothetical protein
MAAFVDTDESDSEEEELLLLALLLDEPVRNERRWWVHDTLKTREQLGEYHTPSQGTGGR